VYVDDGNVKLLRMDQGGITVAGFRNPIAVTEAAPRLIDEKGNDLGEITGMTWHDGSVHGDPESWNVYKVRVKREK
jgi:hypothetical protein